MAPLPPGRARQGGFASIWVLIAILVLGFHEFLPFVFFQVPAPTKAGYSAIVVPVKVSNGAHAQKIFVPPIQVVSFALSERLSSIAGKHFALAAHQSAIEFLKEREDRKSV